MKTNQKKVVIEFQESALKELIHLKNNIEIVGKELEMHVNRRDGRAFPIDYVTMLEEKIRKIYCEISRANGAAVVYVDE